MATKTASITIKGANGETHDVGYRIFLLNTLTGYGLEVEMPKNIPQGVKVFVEGDEEIIQSAAEELKTHKPNIEGIGEVSVNWEFVKHDLKPLDVLGLQLLTLDQISKGIQPIKQIDSVVSNLGLISRDVKPIGEINKVVGGLNDKYHTISQTLNYLLYASVILVIVAIIFGVLILIK